MAIIYTYPRLSNLDNSDLLLISDSTSKRKPTMSVKLGDLSTYIVQSQNVITGTGTLDSVPIFIGPNTIGDSIITYDGAGAPQNDFMSIGGTNVGNNGGLGFVSTDFLLIKDIFALGGGVVTLNGDTQIGDASTDLLTVNAESVFNAKIRLKSPVFIEDAVSSSLGLKFVHPAGGASSVVDMYFAGSGVGSKFIISRSATGGAEIELQANGDINLNRTGNGGILLGNLQSFANDAAAGAGGLVSNKLYQTDGTAPAPLNIAGIVMIKQ